MFAIVPPLFKIVRFVFVQEHLLLRSFFMAKQNLCSFDILKLLIKTNYIKLSLQLNNHINIFRILFLLKTKI